MIDVITPFFIGRVRNAVIRFYIVIETDLSQSKFLPFIILVSGQKSGNVFYRILIFRPTDIKNETRPRLFGNVLEHKGKCQHGLTDCK